MKNNILIQMFFGWLFLLMAVEAEAGSYVVGGGKGTPLMAKEEKAEKLQVYLTYGMDNVSISYTAASSARHQWYRYKSKRLEAEPVTAEQNGNTSTLRNVEAGYGYFVEEADEMTSYVYLIDYSRYAFAMEAVAVAGDCDYFRLEGAPLPERMSYFLPASGRQVELERRYEISYQTLVWSDEERAFSRMPVTLQMTGNPFAGNIKGEDGKPAMPPLCDTEVTLSGDAFADHFGVGRKLVSDTYQAVSVELHTDTTALSDQAPNMTLGEGDALCAPAEVTFRAIANEPVASMYTWKIYRSDVENGAENPIILYRDSEVEYTFTERGNYVAEVTVYDRTGQCEASASYTVRITESFLEIPNAFSPGTTPGINDEFRVAYRSLLNYKCWIFNRWGQELFHSNSPAVGWDGKYKGKYVAPGVYFYVIEATGTGGEKFNKKGSINLLRPKRVNDEIIESE